MRSKIFQSGRHRQIEADIRTLINSIANAEQIEINESYSRRQWMLEFCDRLLEFYPREILKIEGRIDHFKKIREFWEQKDS